MDSAESTMVADVSVSVGGAELSQEAYSDLLDVEVVDEVGMPTMFSLRIATWDQNTLAFSWVDSSLYSIGAPVVIQLGYLGALATMVKGEITSLELELASDEIPILLVRGYDRLHRLLRGTSTRSFVRMKDSDIAASVARGNGLSPVTQDSGVTLEYVLQHAQSDFHFLRQRAEAIGYEMAVDDTTFFFRPRANASKPALTLSADSDLLELRTQMTTRNQVNEVDVRGWDPALKQPIIARAFASSSSAMGGTSGAATTKDAFGAATSTWADHPVFSQQEADQLARARLASLALMYLRAEGESVGRTDLRAGKVAEIQGAGQRFSGAYYVTSSKHTYSARGGYRTEFAARRDAS